MKLIVQFEEAGGGKYNKLIEVEGGSAINHITIDFKDLNAADDSKDDNGKFDADQVSQLVFLEVTGMIDRADGENTLWIGNLRAAK